MPYVDRNELGRVVVQYANAQYENQEYIEDYSPDLLPINPIPSVVTMRQARIALYQAGLLQAVNDAIANMPGVQGDAARIEWEFSNDVKRDQPLVIAMKPLLGLDDAQLDALFLAASQL